MGTCDGAGGEPSALDTSWRNHPVQPAPAGNTEKQYASCGDMVQSNGTCGLWGCSNYGKE